MKSLLAAAAGAGLLAAAAPVFAQGAAPEPKISQVIVYGDDPCPESTDEMIVVCAKKPEGERYRIPEGLRSDPNDPENQSWAARATELQYVGRSGIGSCSPAGAGGMIGCFNQLVNQARAERTSPDAVNWNRLIEEARRERLGRIDEDAAAAEAESEGPR